MCQWCGPKTQWLWAACYRMAKGWIHCHPARLGMGADLGRCKSCAGCPVGHLDEAGGRARSGCQMPCRPGPIVNRTRRPPIGFTSWWPPGVGAHWAGISCPPWRTLRKLGWGLKAACRFWTPGCWAKTARWHPSVTGWPHTTKQPLRELAQKRGLAEVAARPKHPFEAPPLWSEARSSSVASDVEQPAGLGTGPL